MLAWLERRGGSVSDYIFPSRIDHARPIGTRQYARLVDERVTGIDLRCEDYGTRSLRRTEASIIYKQTGNLRAVQILPGHTEIDGTVCNSTSKTPRRWPSVRRSGRGAAPGLIARGSSASPAT